MIPLPPAMRCRFLFSMVLLCGLVGCAWGGGAAASGHSATQAASAKVAIHDTTADFYSWYLAEFVKLRNPLGDEPGKMALYVSKALLAQLHRQASSEDGPDHDYFLQAQDYLEDWPGSIAVSDITVHGRTGSALVTLGRTPQTEQRLSVRLVQEAARWKISRVGRAPDHGASAR